MKQDEWDSLNDELCRLTTEMAEVKELYLHGCVRHPEHLLFRQRALQLRIDHLIKVLHPTEINAYRARFSH